MTSTVTNMSSRWSEIMNNQNNQELLDKQEEFIHKSYLDVMKGLSGIRLQNCYDFTILPEELDKSSFVPMFLSLSDRSLLENMLNSDDFKMIRLDSSLGDLDYGEKILARWSTDFRIYRAQVEDKLIMKRTNKTKYNIRFVDYGNAEMQVDRSSLFFYHPELDKIPFQAVTAKLSSIYGRQEKKSKLAELKNAPGGNIFCRIDTLDWTKFPQAHITMVSKQVENENDVVFQEEAIAFDKNMPQEKAVIVQSWILNNNFDVKPDDNQSLASGTKDHNQIDTDANASPVDDVNYDFKDERRLSGDLSEEEASKVTIDVDEMEHFSPTQLEDKTVKRFTTVDARTQAKADTPLNKIQPRCDSVPVYTVSSSKPRSPVFLDFSFPEQLTKCQYIRYCTPDKFFVTDVTNISTLADIRTAMEENNNINIPVNTKDLVVGSCWAVNSPDRGWVRVKLMKDARSHSPTDTVRARYIDLSIEARVSISDLTWLPDDSVASCTGGLVLPCSLGAGIEFSKKADDFIKTTLKSQSFDIFVNKFDELANIFFVAVVIDEYIELLPLLQNARLIDGNNDNSLGDSGVDSDDDNVDEVYDGIDKQEHDGDDQEGVWDPMEEDFSSRKNTLENPDTDPEVALMGRSNMEDYCSKFLLYGKCPRKQFCPQKHMSISQVQSIHSSGGNIEMFHCNGQASRLEGSTPTDKIKISSVFYIPSTKMMILMKESVYDGFQYYNINEISQAIDDPSNEQLDRTLYKNIGELIGVKTKEHGWVRARILDECENGSGLEEYSLYLVDLGVEVKEFTPRPQHAKELKGYLQELPPLVVKAIHYNYNKQDFQQKLEEFLASTNEWYAEINDEVEQDIPFVQLYAKEENRLEPFQL